MTTLTPSFARLAASCLAAAALFTACAAEDPSGDVNPFRSTSNDIRVACGTVMASFNGTNAYSNGPDTGTGNSCNGSNRYQCVELAMRYFEQHFGLHWYGNARDLLNNAPRASVSVYSNGDGAHPPVPGDMLVWTNGEWGHVAIITRVRSSAVDIIEQNASFTGTAALPWNGSHIGARWGGWIPAGWAHAHANGGTPPSGCAGSASGTSSIWTCTSDRTERQRCVSGSVQTERCSDGCVSQPSGVNDYCRTPPVSTCEGSASGTSSVWTCTSDHTARQRCESGTVQTERCSAGCVSQPSGVDDYCATPTCAGSASGTSSIWTCTSDHTARQRCESGVVQTEACPEGCVSEPSGTNDYCRSISWSCANSAYDGAQWWTCSGGNLYECSGGVPREQTCQAGCLSRPVGTNDLCIEYSSGWACADSAYGGAQWWTCSGGNLHRCSGGGQDEIVHCPSGCTVRPVGTNDTCN